MNCGASGTVANTTGHPASLSPPLTPPPSITTTTTTTTTSTIAAASKPTITTSTIPQAHTSSQFNANLADILVDTSNFVDIRQQDSSSNQSGSDSGLGHTNSVSSDNPTFTAVVQDHHSSKNNNVANSNVNSSSSKQRTAGSASLCTKNNKLSSINESRTNLIDGSTSQQSSSTKANRSKETKHPDEPVARPVETCNELVVPSSQAQQNLPVIKSLLKKPSRVIHGESAIPKTHKRHVSFNQTVIVFCEEIEAPSPSDRFEPPLNYQDSSAAFHNFEPPKDYCDRNIEDSRREETVGRVVHSLGETNDEIHGDGLAKALGADSASNLTDDQLFDLLEDESLLESFRLNCEEFSEDEFPVNYLNSNHAYLCNDAISDYDSDSESSLCVNRKDASLSSAPVKRATNSVGKSNSIDLKKNLKHNQSTSVGVTSDTQSIRISNETDELAEPKSIEHCNNARSAQKTMPARMKVSTLDNVHLKRHLNQDHDLKSKVESRQKLNPNEDGRSKYEKKQSSGDSIGPFLIKQSTVEPITLTKLMVAPTNNPSRTEQAPGINKKASDDLLGETNQENSMKPNPVDQIADDLMRAQEAVLLSSKNQVLRLNQTDTNSNQVQVSHAPNNSTCHICRAIESNRSQVNNEVKDVTGRADTVRQISTSSNHETHISLNQMRATQTTIPSPPSNVFNQSCVSCRESSANQQNVVAKNGTPLVQTSEIAPQPRPIACQVVYVVDQNANRVRALQIVRPPVQNSANPGQQVLTGRRIFIAQNGLRFPNPVAMSQPANFPNNMAGNPGHLPTYNLSNATSGQQYRLLNPVQSQQLNPVQRGQFVATQSSNYRIAEPHNSYKYPLGGLGPRQHTVYYVRQPLGTQNIRQSFESGETNFKSFPDAHEIRRLDGLRGPTTGIHLNQKLNQTEPPPRDSIVSGEGSNIWSGGESVRKLGESGRNEMDDPTFGFSKRPSVKVVASNKSNDSLNMRTATGNLGTTVQNQPPAFANMANVRHTHIIDQNGFIKPISLVVLGSQTLDRRISNQQHTYSMKENLPSTSSMSNIHGILANAQPNQVKSSTNNQLRISNDGSQTINLPSGNVKLKEPPDIGVNLNGLENKRLISNDRLSTGPVFQGQRISNVNENSNTLSTQQRSGQGQSEIAYSMNI